MLTSVAGFPIRVPTHYNLCTVPDCAHQIALRHRRRGVRSMVPRDVRPCSALGCEELWPPPAPICGVPLRFGLVCSFQFHEEDGMCPPPLPGRSLTDRNPFVLMKVSRASVGRGSSGQRRRFPAALQVSLNRSSGGLTISAGTDWSKVHMYQYVHELGTRAHRSGSQRSTKPNVTLEVKVVRSVSSGLWNHWDCVQDFFAMRPAQEVEGPSAQPAFELQFRVGPSSMERHFFGVQLVGVPVGLNSLLHACIRRCDRAAAPGADAAVAGLLLLLDLARAG